MVEVFEPKNIEEAVEILSGNHCTILAGGTDLMVKHKRWSGTKADLGSSILIIDKIQSMKEVSISPDIIEIGAGVTLDRIAIEEGLPNILKEAALGMASPAIRNTATIGGNIVNSSPAGDMLPPLYVLGAELVLSSLKDNRVVPIDDFILGPGKNIIRKDEILTKVRFKNWDILNQCYRKVGTRKSIALSKASFCGIKYRHNEEIKGSCAFGSVGPKVVCSRKMDKELFKSELDDIMTEYSSIIRPIDDQRSTAEYRKEVSLRLLKSWLEIAQK